MLEIQNSKCREWFKTLPYPLVIGIWNLGFGFWRFKLKGNSESQKVQGIPKG
jgi:hypothetical protein